MDFRGTGTCLCGKQMEGGGGSFGGALSTSWRSCSCGMKALFFHVLDEEFKLVAGLERKNKHEYDKKEKDKLLSIFKLADIDVTKSYDIKNGYHGETSDWLLAKTELGDFIIGWRKRVISIDWSDTGIKHLISDDVTKDETSCHAWSYEKAVSYLTEVKNHKVYC